MLTKALIERSVYFVLNSFCSENKITLVIEDGSWIDEAKNLLPPNYPLKFMWEGPQFEWNIKNNNWENAYTSLMVCLEPTQKKWPIAFTALLQRAIKYWNNKVIDNYKQCCQQIIENSRSQKLGFC